LISNISLNSVQDRVIVKWLAIGDRNGVCDIEEGEAPNLDRISLFPFQRREGCAKIFMKMLDSFIEEEEIRRVDFIRMDFAKALHRDTS
jgi:hypothetical protein